MTDDLQRPELARVFVIQGGFVLGRSPRNTEQGQRMKITRAGVTVKAIGVESLRQTHVNISLLLRDGLRQPGGIDMQESGFAAQAQVRMAEQIVARVAEHKNTQALAEVLTLRPEHVLPAMGADTLPQSQIAARNQHATLIKLR